jgi:hypothetical protein
MKKTTIILLSVVWLGLGYGTIEAYFSPKAAPHEELKLPPSPGEVEYDKSGAPIFTDEQLSGNKKPFNLTGVFLAVGFLTVTGLVVRQIRHPVPSVCDSGHYSDNKFPPVSQAMPQPRLTPPHENP